MHNTLSDTEGAGAYKVEDRVDRRSYSLGYLGRRGTDARQAEERGHWESASRPEWATPVVVKGPGRSLDSSDPWFNLAYRLGVDRDWRVLSAPVIPAFHRAKISTTQLHQVYTYRPAKSMGNPR